MTRSLLGYGVLVGPLYVAVSLGQALTRDGFDLTRHSWSLLANGSGGWLQTANLIVAGIMVLAAAAGLVRSSADGGHGRRAAGLVGLYGVSLVAAGIFRADPMTGFPLGTPDGPPLEPTLHGTLHVVAGGVGFAAVVAASLIAGRRYARTGHGRLALLSRGTAATVVVGIAAAGTGPGRVGTLLLTSAVLMTWAWLAAISRHAYRAAGRA